MNEIMNPDQYTTIMTTLATLVAGQEGTNEHLRILNGKVVKHEESLNTLLLWKAQAKGFGQAIGIGWGFVGVLLSGGGVVLISFFYWLTHH